jgi:hypothetical protein
MQEGQHGKDENEDARFIINFVQFRVERVEEEHKEKAHQYVKPCSGDDQYVGRDLTVNMETVENRRHDEGDFGDG